MNKLSYLKSTKEDRIELWKFQHVLMCMGLVRKQSELLLEIKRHDPCALYQQLTSLYILYGRPFKRSYPRYLQVEEEEIPKNLRVDHNNAITLRDKIFAHIDIEDAKYANFNNLVICKMRGKYTPMIHYYKPGSDNLTNLAQLAKKLSIFSESKIQKIWDKYDVEEHYVEGGEFKIDVLTQEKSPLISVL